MQLRATPCDEEFKEIVSQRDQNHPQRSDAPGEHRSVQHQSREPAGRETVAAETVPGYSAQTDQRRE